MTTGGKWTVPLAKRDARTLRILLEHYRADLALLARLKLDDDPDLDAAELRERVRDLISELARRGLKPE